MFKVTRWKNNGNFSITDENKNYLHADGQAYYKCGEYWPTRELAQAVLDKYQSSHVWKYGDVFKTRYGMPMIYFRYVGTKPPQVFCFTTPVYGPATNIGACLRDATFLFNIREKL